MQYNFNEFIPRENTGSTKWSYIEKMTGEKNALPLWVADMDFETVPEVKQALVDRAQHGIYGYTVRPDGYYQAIVDWMKKRHRWEIKTEWITHSTGVVNGIYNAIYAFTKPGDGVVIQPPVYHPFPKAIQDCGREVVLNPLRFEAGRYSMDLDDLEEKLETRRPTALLLCNPHNPVGRVFNREELEALGKLCLQYNVLVLSDEIHCDFVYSGSRFIPFASLSEDLALRSVILTAPSKTFNLAGLSTSNIIIPNPELKARYDSYCEKIALKPLNIFGILACETAYRQGEPWLDQLLKYLEENKNHAIRYIRDRIPALSATEPEGTYFLWVDFRNTGLKGKELEHFLLHNAELWFNQGYTFGAEGDGFARINLACQRSTLDEALRRLERAIQAKK